MSHTVLLDLETYAIDTVADYIEEPTAPGNYKNPDAIANYVAEARRKLVTKAALKPDLGRIVCLGWQVSDRDSEPRVLTCKDEGEERGALEIFWDDFGEHEGSHVNHRLVTFGGHRFDLPFLMRRSQVLRTPYPRLRVDRGSPHLDLYRVMTFDDAIDGYSLQFYLRRYDLDPGIEDGFTGADIAQLVAHGQWADVAKHCRADVQRLYYLASWLGVIEPRAEPEIGF